MTGLEFPTSQVTWDLKVFFANRSPSEEINSALLEETVMASPEVISLQDAINSPKDPPPSPLSLSRPVTWLESQQALHDEEQRVTRDEVHPTPKEVRDVSQFIQMEIWGICVGMVRGK